MHPTIRRTGLITRQVDGELVVYDTSRHVAHRLTASAARVWEQCDGRSSTAEIAQRIGTPAEPMDEASVVAALDALREAALLADEPATANAVSRRRAVQRMAAVALAPLVVSIAAPTPADALSGGGGGPKSKKPKTPKTPKAPKNKKH